MLPRYTDWALPMTPQEQDRADELSPVDSEYSGEFVVPEVVPVIINQVESDCKILDEELARINADIERYYEVTDSQHNPDIAGRIKDGYLTDWLLIINRKNLYKFVQDGNKIKLLRPRIRYGELTIEGILHLRNQVVSLRRLLPRLIRLAAIIDLSIGMNRIDVTRVRRTAEPISLGGSGTLSSITSTSELYALGSGGSSASVSGATFGPSASSELIGSESGSETVSASESISDAPGSAPLSGRSSALTATESIPGSGASSRSGSAARTEL